MPAKMMVFGFCQYHRTHAEVAAIMTQRGFPMTGSRVQQIEVQAIRKLARRLDFRQLAEEIGLNPLNIRVGGNRKEDRRRMPARQGHCRHCGRRFGHHKKCDTALAKLLRRSIAHVRREKRNAPR